MFLFKEHTIKTFIDVQKQMWWYHTNLKATHPYTSPWWSWPFLVRPIWLHVDYVSATTIKNIYAMGNPAVFWTGVLVIPYVFYEASQKKLKNLGLILFSYFMFFIPWALSPRIMFLYHYLPSIPFLSILIGYFLAGTKKYTQAFIIISVSAFIFFYPHWTGLEIPKWLNELYFIFPSWK
jgi:dolichyl-phosphate-mannose--protein O-mannosyl transferase